MSAYPITARVVRLMHELDHPAPCAGAVLLMAAAENTYNDLRARLAEASARTPWQFIVADAPQWDVPAAFGRLIAHGGRP